jgi:hypothetical protein
MAAGIQLHSLAVMDAPTLESISSPTVMASGPRFDDQESPSVKHDRLPLREGDHSLQARAARARKGRPHSPAPAKPALSPF